MIILSLKTKTADGHDISGIVCVSFYLGDKF